MNDVTEKIEKAREIVRALCLRQTTWQMTIPPGFKIVHSPCLRQTTWQMTIPPDFKRDPDAVITDALNCAENLINSLSAENARLRAALEELARLGNGNEFGNSEGNLIAQKALKGGE